MGQKTRDVVEERRWIKTSHLARRYGVTTETVKNWARRGLLPQPIRHVPNGHYFWDEAEVTAAMERLAREAVGA